MDKMEIYQILSNTVEQINKSVLSIKDCLGDIIMRNNNIEYIINNELFKWTEISQEDLTNMKKSDTIIRMVNGKIFKLSEIGSK